MSTAFSADSIAASEGLREKQRVAKFLRAVNSTQQWLDDNFDDASLSSEVHELIKTLRAYLRYCRHQIDTKHVKLETLDRRQRKIEDAMVDLWNLSQSGEI